eukprot:1157450-Pelagomonas_calceolata.AAC.6
MLDLKGNTAVYLLYAHARIAGIARKVGRPCRPVCYIRSLSSLAAHYWHCSQGRRGMQASAPHA